MEALADLINSETQQEKDLSIKMLTGYYKNIYVKLKIDLINCLARSEAYIDFEEEENDVKSNLYSDVGNDIKRIIEKLKGYIIQYEVLKNKSNESLNMSIVVCN